MKTWLDILAAMEEFRGSGNQAVMVMKGDTPWQLSKPQLLLLRNGDKTFTAGLFGGIPRWHSGNESTCQCRRHERHRFDPWVGKSLWRRKWQPTPVLLPGNFHRRRSLVGYSPRGLRESDTTSPQHNKEILLQGVFRPSQCEFLKTHSIFFPFPF